MTVLLKSDAFARAEIIDAELDWPRGLAAGRIAKLYEAAQKARKSVIKRRLVLEWACIEPAHADRFIALCCSRKERSDDETDHIHFLEPRSDDSFFIVGNPKQLQKLDNFIRRASAGGKAKAAKMAAEREAAEHEVLLEAELEAEPEADDKQCLSAAKPLPSSFSSSCSLSSAVKERRVTDAPGASGVIALVRDPEPPPPKRARAAPRFDPLDRELAACFQAHIARHNPDAVRIHRADLDAWANVFRLMREADGLSYRRIGEVMQYATGDPFWSIAIQSPAKLRKQWDRLTAEMRRKAKKNRGGFKL